jgi:2-phospho-L-lactate guanylyltransferase (CobY/MobA/RfbA family)
MRSTAILVFCNNPKLDAQLKKLLPSASLADNEQLHRYLRNRVLREARNTAVDVLHCPLEIQRGATFADRMQNAFADAFARGYTQVLLVGTDAAAMHTEALNQLLNGLSTNTAVLAPDRRGGAWAIGLHQTAFQQVNWNEITWHSDRVLNELAAQLSSVSLHLAHEQTLLDLNHACDLSVFRRDPADAHVQGLLLLLNNIIAATPVVFCVPPSEQMDAGVHPIRRGPPQRRAA